MSEIKSVQPPYLQVAHHISEQIVRGDLKPGDKIPSERELREQWGISKATANKVLHQLKAEGFVHARVGVGSIVASATGTQGAGPRSMWQRVRDRGAIRLPNEHSERETGWLPSAQVPAQVQAALGGTNYNDFVFRRRVIFRDDVPYATAVSWFFPPLLDQWPGVIDRLLADEPIPEGTPRYIADQLGRDLDTCTDSVAAVPATDELARDLRVEPGAPLLKVLSTITVEDGWVIEVGEYHYPALTSVAYTYAV